MDTYKCKVCNESFRNKQGLGGHIAAVHFEGKRYSVSRLDGNYRGRLPKSKCKYCGASLPKRRSFCDNKCQGRFARAEQVNKLLAGEVGNKYALKELLLEMRGANCEFCGQGQTWNGLPLVLHLDHIDGNPHNHTIDNARILCPNCHSQTDTFGSKNRGPVTQR